MTLTPELRAEIEQILKSDDVVLFMKGTPAQPACGFSAAVSGILDELLPAYRTVNVLERGDLREGIKEFANWPTIPQLFVRGELVGGADIVRSMASKGELPKLLGVSVPEVARPGITVTPAAAKALAEALAEGGDSAVRLEIDRSFKVGLDLDAPRGDDFRYEQGGVTVVIDRQSARRADGVTIDFVEKSGQSGFKITNPNEPPRVQGVGARELAERMKAGPVALFDVRTPEERAIARIEGARLYDADADAAIQAMDKATPLYFLCHHGGRSMSVGQRYVGLGFKQVFNLEGGIAAWSREVDPSVPQY